MDRKHICNNRSKTCCGHVWMYEDEIDSADTFATEKSF